MVPRYRVQILSSPVATARALFVLNSNCVVIYCTVCEAVCTIHTLVFIGAVMATQGLNESVVEFKEVIFEDFKPVGSVSSAQ